MVDAPKVKLKSLLAGSVSSILILGAYLPWMASQFEGQHRDAVEFYSTIHAVANSLVVRSEIPSFKNKSGVRPGAEAAGSETFDWRLHSAKYSVVDCHNPDYLFYSCSNQQGRAPPTLLI